MTLQNLLPVFYEHNVYNVYLLLQALVQYWLDPQEQFYGCADIAITSSGGSVSSSHDNHPVLQQGGVVGFIPINSGTGQSITVCKATPMFKARYPINLT
jgi:hypothetical protein